MDELEMEQMHDGIDTLRAENERIRAEVERLRDQLEIRIQHGHNLRTMLESATETERAAVVAWLRHADRMPSYLAALAIVQGEHRREEET